MNTANKSMSGRVDKFIGLLEKYVTGHSRENMIRQLEITCPKTE